MDEGVRQIFSLVHCSMAELVDNFSAYRCQLTSRQKAQSAGPDSAYREPFTDSTGTITFSWLSGTALDFEGEFCRILKTLSNQVS
jgi:hypothetical protein